jgi:hypothetical protein
MEWEKAWKQIEDGNSPGLDSYLGANKKTPWRSKHPLQQIRKSLMWTNMYGIVITLGYIVIMVFYPHWQLVLLFSIVAIFNIYFIVRGIQLYKNIPDHISAEASLLHEMETQHSAVKKWVDMQLLTAKFVYPVAAAAGFLFGGMLGSERSIGELFGKPIFSISMIAAVIIFTPIGHYLGKYLVKISYGKYLTRLQQNIDELKNNSSEMP